MVALGLGSERQFGKLRFRALVAVVALALSLLVVRLYVLQVLRHDEFRQKSESNFIQLRRIPHERGTMRDREGRVLVENRASHDVSITPAFMPDARVLLTRVMAAAGATRTAREVADDLVRLVDTPDAPPILIAEDLRDEALAWLKGELER